MLPPHTHFLLQSALGGKSQRHTRPFTHANKLGEVQGLPKADHDRKLPCLTQKTVCSPWDNNKCQAREPTSLFTVEKTSLCIEPLARDGYAVSITGQRMHGDSKGGQER